MNEITFKPVFESALTEFKERLQTAFSLAVPLANTQVSDQPIPSDQDIENNYYNKESETYNIYHNGRRIGGVILSIDRLSNHNHLDFFFLDPAHHNKGLGFEVWKAIEAKYPETEIWETGTPYFEKRNIHFYVNKCGFQINEFFCEYHPDPHSPQEDTLTDPDGMQDGFFNFIKVMRSQK